MHRSVSRVALASLGSFALAVIACGPPAPEVDSAAGVAPAKRARATVTLLYTSDEHGWLAPQVDGAMVRGGAADLLARLVRDEGHCVALEDPKRCPSPKTLLLSGGDSYTGPAISTYFSGEPMAEAIAAIGYAASAFGNHELDFGREPFLKNRALAHLPYLAANVHPTDPALAKDWSFPPFLIFERQGVKIGVVGLATETTLTSAMASRFAGLAIEAEEPALVKAVPEAWAAGADAVVVIAHECGDKLAPIVAKHPELQLSFVFAAHCHKVDQRSAAGVPVASVGWKLEHYLRVRVTIDPARPARDRVVAIEPTIVDVRHDPKDGMADAAQQQRTAAWQAKLDRALGEEVGFSAAGIAEDTPALGRWFTTALREELHTDVAILNTGGLRQGLPKGAITKAAIWSIVPFDNKVVVVSITGKDLLIDLATDEATFAGVVKTARGYQLDDGTPIDPARRYTVATIDYLYFGGSKFRFQEQDRAPKETGIDWRAPIVDWTKRQRSSATAPLEERLRPREGTSAPP